MKNPDLIYIISVPTHRYHKVFGEEFHKNVGHVVEGYSLEELEKLFYRISGEGEKRFSKISYNTGLLGNIGANLYYKKGKDLPLFVREIISKPFTFFDINNKNFSSSLFAVFGEKDIRC